MTHHENMQDAQTAAASRGASAWCAEGLAYLAPKPGSVEKRNMTEEEISITERPWEDSQGHPEGSPSSRMSFSIGDHHSIKGDELDSGKASDKASSHVDSPGQSSAIEKSPWEESLAFSTEHSPGLSPSPAFGQLPFEDSSDAWK
jgi:hypothetical protein